MIQLFNVEPGDVGSAFAYFCERWNAGTWTEADKQAILWLLSRRDAIEFLHESAQYAHAHPQPPRAA